MRTIRVTMDNGAMSQVSERFGVDYESALGKIKEFSDGRFYKSHVSGVYALFVPQLHAYFLLNDIDSSCDEYRARKMRMLESVGVSTVPVYVEYCRTKTLRDLLPAFLRQNF